MKIEPFGERVAIRLIQQEETTKSGLIMTTDTKVNSNKGVVEALGSSVDDFFTIGDTVIFNQGAGVSYTDGDEDYRIIGTKDILCKIVKE